MQAIIETTKMSTKGQLIIPQKTRQFTRSGEESIFVVTPTDRNTIVLKKLDEKKVLRELRSIRSRVKRK
ncbi:MAG: AbrB/MazE/SpoVT family DNA-binding domain-containing protein, partial [Candidatus Diapherotrites archaeon]|nr:AbrB/MazE/SpoVT family DNA-binding domain-containing protein [Candidatus Diapherotrites archaeon]